MTLNYYQACKILKVAPGAKQSEIKKAYRDLILKWAIDKWKQNTSQGRSCPEGKCGVAPREGGERYFHSKKCQETFEKVEKNHNLVQEAYEALTGKGNSQNSGGDEASDQPQLDICKRCGKKYPFNTRFKEFKKGKGENDNFWFCSEKCYNCFNVCDNCGTIGKINDNEIREGIWKEKGWGSAEGKIFCSPQCYQKLQQKPNNFDSESLPNCYHCKEKLRANEKGVYTSYTFTGRDEIFCSENCRKKWEEEWRKNNQGEQTNIPKPQQTDVQTKGGKGREKSETEGNGLGDNSNNIPNQNGEENNNQSLPQDIREITNLPLPQAQAKAEQKIEKLLKDNTISEQELDKENLGESSNWKDYLKSLDTPQKVAEFTYQMEQAILKKVLTKKNSATEQKPKEDDLVKPIAIAVLSLLFISTLLIIVRKRRQKRF